MYRKINSLLFAAAAAKSLTEIIPLIGISAISGQYPVFSHPESL